jgi:hypothetical protein
MSDNRLTPVLQRSGERRHKGANGRRHEQVRISTERLSCPRSIHMAMPFSHRSVPECASQVPDFHPQKNQANQIKPHQSWWTSLSRFRGACDQTVGCSPSRVAVVFAQPIIFQRQSRPVAPGRRGGRSPATNGKTSTGFARGLGAIFCA